MRRSSLVNQTDYYSALPSYWQLRKEAIESWDYFVADKLVYFPKVTHSEVKSSFLVSEREDGPATRWIESHFTLSGKGKSHFCAIIHDLNESMGSPFGRNGFKLHPDGIDKQMAVLLDVPQGLQSPEMGFFVMHPVVVRLKLIHDGDCLIGDSSGASVDLPPLRPQSVLPRWESKPYRRAFVL
jgi:hypothetical protein